MEAYDVNKFIADIFESNDTAWKPSDKIPLITKEIESLKEDLKLFLERNNYDIDSFLLETKEICKTSTLLVLEMEMCQKEVEEQTMAEIQKSIQSKEELAKELESIDYMMNILHDVIHSSKCLKEFRDALKVDSNNKAAQALYELGQYLEPGAEGFSRLDFYVNMKVLYDAVIRSFQDRLTDQWEDLVSWNTEQTPRKSEIILRINLHDNLHVKDTLTALEKSDSLTEKVLEFADFFFNDIVKSIIYHNCTVYEDDSEQLNISIIHESCKPKYDLVISNLKVLFKHLSYKIKVEHFRNSIMEIMSKDIALKFRDVIIKDCLIHTVPCNVNDLLSYDKITSDIEDFEQFLIKIKIFPAEGCSILEYINNIDELFANRSSQCFLETARNIMLKDLSDSMSIGVESIPESTINNEEDDGPHSEALKILDKTIPQSLFYFPRCMISKSTQELLDLVVVLMEQAVQCSDIVCKKLFSTGRLMFELYDAIVPYHHEHYLQTIPQYVALFHNNCMYLAHNLQNLGDKWLILMEGREVDYPMSFMDLVQKLRDLGYKHISVHMQQQRKQILDNLRSSDLNCIVVRDVLGDDVEAAIRQCLRQLQLLKNVWIGVFPRNVFKRLMATLVNMFIDELIHRVCTVEDISMEMATQLTELYSLVMQKSPQLFQNPEDIETNVKSWIKLKELIFILGGSLKDIENHWEDGKGSLAEHFKVEELRNLIKALFQNTQIRANLLSKIK